MESRGKQAAETGKKRGGKRKEQGKTGKLQKRKKKGNQRGQNFGEREKGSDREGSKTEESEGTEKLKPKEQNRGGKLLEKREEQRLGGHCTEEKKDRSSPRTTAVLPLRRHNSTVILPLSRLPTLAETEREKRNRTETEDNAEKGRRTTIQAAPPVPRLPPAL